MVGYHILDFIRVNIEAGNQDHVLFPVHDFEETVFGHHRNVAGKQPSIGCDDLGGFFRALPVPLHDLRAAHHQLTLFALGKQFTLVIHDGAFGGG